MTLDPRPSDAELLRRIAERLAEKGAAVSAGVTPESRRDSVRSRSRATFRNAPKRGAMNRTEALYAEQLELQKRVGEVVDWKYGSFSLRLAKRTWYRPDFFVSLRRLLRPAVFTKTADALLVRPEVRGPTVLEIHEVKGHWEDDARAKFKIAAELYPMFVFRAVRRVDGVFHIIETLNA